MAEEQQTTQAEAKPKEQTQATTPTAATPAETQAEIMIPKHRYDEVSSKLKALEEKAAQEAAAREAEDERKKAEQGEWQSLAEQRQAKLAELEPAHKALTERLTKLEAQVISVLEAEIKNWDAELKAARPKDADAETLGAWVESHRAIAAKLSGQPPAPGNGRRPAPSGPAGSKERKIEPVYDVRRNF